MSNLIIKSTTANARYDGGEDGGDWWERLDADGNGTELYFECGRMDANTGEGYACDVCGRGFTQAEWDDRHDDDDAEDRYFHADCCPICKTSVQVYGEVDA